MMRRLKSIGYRAVVSIGAMIGFAFWPQFAVAQNWDFYTYMNVTTNSAVVANQQLVKEMAEFTNDKMKIRIHLGGTLQISATSIGAAVSDNVVQMADDAFVGGVMPVGEVMRLPLLTRNVGDLKKALDIVFPYIERAYDKRGIVLLGIYTWPQQVFWSRKKLEKLADIRGQKIRNSSPENGEMAKLLGGISITMGTPEVAAALERGVIDGVLSAASGGAYIWKDTFKYSYGLPTGPINSHIIANKSAFQKLAPEVQNQLKKRAKEISANLLDQFILDEAERVSKMKADGIIFTEPTKAELDEAELLIKPYWEAWTKNKGGETGEVLKKLRVALGR